jgi:hypothetical protein
LHRQGLRANPFTLSFSTFLIAFYLFGLPFHCDGLVFGPQACKLCESSLFIAIRLPNRCPKRLSMFRRPPTRQPVSKPKQIRGERPSARPPAVGPPIEECDFYITDVRSSDRSSNDQLPPGVFARQDRIGTRCIQQYFGCNGFRQSQYDRLRFAKMKFNPIICEARAQVG